MTVPAVHNAQQAARLTAQRPQGRADCDLPRSFSAGFSRVRLSFLSGKKIGCIRSPWLGFREGAARRQLLLPSGGRWGAPGIPQIGQRLHFAADRERARGSDVSQRHATESVRRNGPFSESRRGVSARICDRCCAADHQGGSASITPICGYVCLTGKFRSWHLAPRLRSVSRRQCARFRLLPALARREL
jgi:hypothetical protein